MPLSHEHVNFGPPFDDSDADIILRSSFASILAPGSTEDRVVATDFLVHKSFLIKASSVFKSLLSSSSKTFDQANAEALKHGIKHDTRDNLPVLCLSEDRDTVHRLLTAIYPVDIVYPQTFETIKTFAAARKYGMPSVLTRFRTYCSRVAPVVTAENIFRAYVFALNEGLKEEALEALQLTLSLPQDLQTYGSSLCDASGPALRALWKHREMAVLAIERGVSLCSDEVGDLRDWKLNLPGDKDCCVVPAPNLRLQFLLFTERIPQNFSTMNISNFVNTLSTQENSYCTSCGRQQHLDNARLFDCLERYVRGQIEQMHDEFLLLLDGLGEEVIPSSGQPRNFGAPYDRGDSDVTIRSCDCVDFHVHKAVLGIASVTFEDMFTAPGPSPHGDGQVKQIIDLTENSKTLLHLLSVIYPMAPIVPDTFEEALSLLSACQKYQMDFIATRVRAWIRACTPPLFTADNSFRTYGIASHYRLEEEALCAARLTLECSMDFNTLGEDLRFISGADLFRLYRFRNECSRVAGDCVYRTGYMPHTSRCQPSSVHFGHYLTEELLSVARWWKVHFYNRVATQPSPKMVADRSALQVAIASHRTASGCSLCFRPDQKMVGDNLCAVIEAKLSEVIEQVRLDVQT